MVAWKTFIQMNSNLLWTMQCIDFFQIINGSFTNFLFHCAHLSLLIILQKHTFLITSFGLPHEHNLTVCLRCCWWWIFIQCRQRSVLQPVFFQTWYSSRPFLQKLKQDFRSMIYVKKNWLMIGEDNRWAKMEYKDKVNEIIEGQLFYEIVSVIGSKVHLSKWFNNWFLSHIL